MTGVPASAAGGSSGAPGARGSAAAADGARSEVSGSASGPAAPENGGKSARAGKIAAAAVNQASVWNVANLLTMLRLLLVPGFVALMLADGGYDPAWRSLAWAAFAIAMITDLFDGHLARTYNLVTDFREDRRPHRRQGDHGGGAHLSVRPRRSAVVGDGRDPWPGTRHHPAAFFWSFATA